MDQGEQCPGGGGGPARAFLGEPDERGRGVHQVGVVERDLRVAQRREPDQRGVARQLDCTARIDGAVRRRRPAEGAGAEQVDHRDRGLAFGPLRLGRPGRATLWAPPTEPLRRVAVSVHRGGRRGDDREQRGVPHDVLRHPVDQPTRGVLAGERRLEPAAHHELPEHRPVLRGPCVVLGRPHHVPRAVPVGGPPVERTSEVRIVVAEPGPQEGREQRVIAIQRLALDLGEEHAPPFEVGQPRTGLGVVAQRDGQIGRQLVDDARALEEPLDRLVLAFEHLGEQVLRHGLLCRPFIVREAPRIRALLDRVGDQPEPGRPPLGPLVDGEDVALGDVQSVCLEEFGRLGRPEEEVCVPDLAQTALHAEPTDPQRRVGATGDEQVELLGGPLDEAAQRRDRAGGGELVDVVEHEHRPLSREDQLVEGFVEQCDVVVAPEGVPGGERVDPPERVEDRSDESTRQVVIPLDGHPRGGHVVGPAGPAGEQGGLPGARRCRHQGHLAALALGQQRIEARSGHDGLRQPGHPRPGRSHRRAQDHSPPSSLDTVRTSAPADRANIGRPRPSRITHRR